ncbi:polyprenyl synthetase family protein [Leucobacter sp. USHLN153]|uniref:polyprenyl synthetase family protein n=1 Tax=Leucobacter sp. USHLN153 TaxID=3081268 RepID=UPI0030173725
MTEQHQATALRPTEAVEFSIDRVQARLEEFFANRIREAEAYHPAYAHLWKLCSERTLGGKRIRPRLLLDFAAALGAETESNETLAASVEAIVDIATAVELLHASFLLHDDVFDGDLVRRGTPNLIGALVNEGAGPLEQAAVGPGGAHDSAGTPSGSAAPNRLHWARTCGILMGDLLLAEVHQLFARTHVADAQRTQLLDLLAHAITESVVGEQLDVGLEDGTVAADTATVLEMCRLKTATYTFELPLRAAAILAGSSSPAIDAALAAAGAHLGLAFQLQDDLLSTFGDPEVHGKDAYSDLREGKETAVIAAARMTAAWPQIEPSFGSGRLDAAEGARVQELLRECGAERFVRGLIDDQMRALHETLADATSGLPDRARQTLLALADRLDGRRS